MANMFWTGAAIAAAQVDDFTPANVEVGDVFSIQATDDEGGDYIITFTATAATVQNVVEGLKAAADAARAAGYTPWDEITAGEDDTKLTLTVDTAGKPVYYTTSAVNGGAADTQTLTKSNVTPNSGPYDWNCLDNWNGDGDLPGADAGDIVYIDGGIIKYGLDQSAIANALSGLYITRSQVGQNGDTGESPSYLQIKSSIIEINKSPGIITPPQSAPVNIDAGSTAAIIQIYGSGTNPVASEPAVNIKANNASTKVYIYKGSVGIAGHSGETTTVDDVYVSYTSSKATDVDLVIGPGVTVDDIDVSGGQTRLGCAADSVDVSGGELITEGTGTVATLAVSGGNVYPNSTGTITDMPVTGGVVDFTKSKAIRTVTNPKLDGAGKIIRDPDYVTFTNGLESDGPVALQASAA